eukprot:Tamp_25435.p1 GENE.Tamp_25435~~Tamp_25435.p1  ORF type:complete len:247 (+),score=63.15 Tamp_25435:30-743(+)
MAASGPLLPGSGPASAAGRTAVARRTAVALVLAAAAAAAAVGSVLSTYGAAGSRADAELAQFDAYVRRQRGTWDSIDARVVAPAGVQLRGARRASLSQLAERPRALRVSRARPMSLAQARRADSTPLARKEWRDVDIVGLMDAQKAAFSTLQQLAKEKGGKKEEEKSDAPCCGDSQDASIHNDGFYLNGNSLQGGSNVIIYGTGAHVEHGGGGVANGGAVGPGGGGGGGGFGGGKGK